MRTSATLASLLTLSSAASLLATRSDDRPDHVDTASPAQSTGISFVLNTKRTPRRKRWTESSESMDHVRIIKRDGIWAPPMPAHADWEYSTPFSVGGQTFNLNLDTGSSDFWVFSQGMPIEQFKDPNGNGTIAHGLYSVEKSSSHSAWQDYYFNICYSDNTCASGAVANETIGFGGATVTGLPIGLASAVSNALTNDYHTDGVVGLGFRTQNSVYQHLPEYSLNSSQPQMTFLEAILPTLNRGVFTVTLSVGLDGAYEFGAINKNRYKGEIHYAPVDTRYSLWMFPLATTVYIGDQLTYDMKCITRFGIADTGATLLKMSNDIVEAYYSQIPSAQVLIDGAYAGGYIYSCNDTTPTPAFTIGLGTDGAYNLTIPAGQMTHDVFNANGTQCYGKLQKFDNGGLDEPAFFSVGIAVLKQYFVVFDMQDMRIGFADRVSY